MTDKSVAHVIQEALQAAGFGVVVTGYSSWRMTLVATDDAGHSFDVSAEISRMRPVGAVLRGLVSDGAEATYVALEKLKEKAKASIGGAK